MTIKRILFATDFSKASRPAFTLARELAKVFKSELILFHAYQLVPTMAGEVPMPPAAFQEMLAATRKGVRSGLERLAKVAGQDRIRMSILALEGPATSTIVRAAKRKRAGLIVLGTHGRTGVTRILLGSVADRVVRTAPCPVLTVGAR